MDTTLVMGSWYSVLNSSDSVMKYVSKLKSALIVLACDTDGTKLLVKFVGETVSKSLFRSPTCVPGLEYAP